MSATLIPEGKFYPADHGRHNSTENAAITKGLENSSTRKLRSNYYREIFEDQKKRSNLNKVRKLMALEQNWNDHDAPPFTSDLISKTIHLLLSINKQPDVFPTARESIQFEYEKSNGDYLEFEIFQDGIYVFFMDDYDNEFEQKIDAGNITKINKMVSDFDEGCILPR